VSEVIEAVDLNDIGIEPPRALRRRLGVVWNGLVTALCEMVGDAPSPNILTTSRVNFDYRINNEATVRNPAGSLPNVIASPSENVSSTRARKLPFGIKIAL
jgi:hypothetical protein